MPKIKMHEFDTREAWLRHRLINVGASEAPALFNEHPFITPFKLAAIKTGRLQVEETKRMKFGTLMQGPALELLQEERPISVIVPNIKYPVRYYEELARPPRRDARRVYL